MVTQLAFLGLRAFRGNQTKDTLGCLLPHPSAAPGTDGGRGGGYVQDAATHTHTRHQPSPCPPPDGSSMHRQHNPPVQRVNLECFVRKQYASFFYTLPFTRLSDLLLYSCCASCIWCWSCCRSSPQRQRDPRLRLAEERW